MTVQIQLVEDQEVQSFHPLTLTRPLWDMRLGYFTLGQKWAFEFPKSSIYGELREEFVGVFDPQIQVGSQWKSSRFADPDQQDSSRLSEHSDSTGNPLLRVNARYLPTKPLMEKLTSWVNRPDSSTLFVHEHQGKRVVVATGIAEKSKLPQSGTKKDTVEVVIHDVEWLEYPWDLLEINGQEIKRDLTRLISAKDRLTGAWDVSSGPQPGFHSNAYVDEPSALFMHPTAIVEPGVTMQISEGPIIIGAGARIMAGSHLKGPLAIGEGAIVKMGALLYKNSSIGPRCKVGGEVSNCIFHSYSNKAHHGYAGNSIFGQWVNLGAGSTTSNLRGNYGEVRVRDWVSGGELNTGRQFLGSIIGDHVKTGINTILNTGTIIGPSSMIFGAGFAPKWIHSFSWMNSDTGEMTHYDVDKSLVDMRRMMARREISLSESYANMMRGISKRK